MKPTTDDGSVTYVVAPSYDRYIRWCVTQGANPRGSAVRYVRRPTDLDAVRGEDRVILLAGWKFRPDWRLVQKTLMQLGKVWC